MSERTVGMIWAQGRNGVIGSGGGMPWRIPEDLVHFRDTTMGAAVIMGRKTWDSLPPQFRPLEGRRNVVVTRNPGWKADGAETASSPEHALAMTDPDEAWFIGGGEVYRAAMPFTNVLAVTLVDADPAGDVTAPQVGTDFMMAYTTGFQTSTGPGTLRYLHRAYARMS
jgi:dihydrofolate reductase